MQSNPTILANGLVVLVNMCFWAMLMIPAAITLFIAFILTCLRLVSGNRRQIPTLCLSAISIVLSVLALHPLYAIKIAYPSRFSVVYVLISLSSLVVSLAVLIISLVPSRSSKQTPPE